MQTRTRVTFTVVRLADGYAVQKTTPRQRFYVERGFHTPEAARQYATYLRRQAGKEDTC